jgi:hypothetical protein
MFVESKDIPKIKNKLTRLRGRVGTLTENDTPIILSIQQILSEIERIIENIG